MYIYIYIYIYIYRYIYVTNSMIEESKYCSDVMKKPFNKEPVMNEDFENSTKCWNCHNDYVNNDVKVCT